MNYLKFLLTRKWAVLLLSLSLCLLIFGLPSYEDGWHWNRISDIKNSIELYSQALIMLQDILDNLKFDPKIPENLDLARFL